MRRTPQHRGPIVCIGEILWDSLPKGLFLGGAPLNVACHIRLLGGEAAIVSRVGADVLGSIIRRRVAEKGLSADLIQIDGTNPTGLVHVTLDRAGSPTFDIVNPSAWDFLEHDDRLAQVMEDPTAVVFGSLAQRSPVSRTTIQSILSAGTLRVFDVNLRPPYDLEEHVHFGLSHADLVKLNDQEMVRLTQWYGLPTRLRDAAEALAGTFGCTTICITRGDHGAALWRDGRWSEHPGFSVGVRDTVGAGDGFLASLTLGCLAGDDDETLLKEANALGAYIATQDGATPAHNRQTLAEIKASSVTQVNGKK
jgi:fructokinase